MQKKLQYGIIGQNIRYTLSPKMHNWGFKQKKINANYQIWETNNLAKFISNLRSKNFSGASVTVPYKKKIITYLDYIDQNAKKIGAVNTIINKNGKLSGFNTDYYGIVMCLKKYTKLKNKKVIILGKGGAAQAAKFGLKKHGAHVKLLSREAINKFKGNFNILINATPVYDKLLINQNLLKKEQIILDLIYHKKTKLLSAAEHKGCIAINGLLMLKYQAEKQFFIWTKQKTDFSNILKI